MIPAIIPAFQKPHQLEKCIQHLNSQTVKPEIFIRDNNHDNVFFTAAINEGIRNYLHHDCQYFLIINQDFYLEPNALEEMINFMDSHPQCGIGAPLQLHVENTSHVIFAGGLEAFPFGKHEGGHISQFTEDKPIHWSTGACLIFRKQMVHEIGLLDENFILIGSDSDYSFTARARGWQVWRIANARGIHEYGVSGELGDAAIEAMKIKDMLYFARKWLTIDLFNELAYEEYSSESIQRIVEQLNKTKEKLENHSLASCSEKL
jgi:GT2 family glycosyltransferase